MLAAQGRNAIDIAVSQRLRTKAADSLLNLLTLTANSI
jgi:hypothetical protein